MAAETARQEAEQKAQTEKAEAQTAQKNAAYAALLDAAKGGGYTAEEIRNLAQRQGITDEADIEMLTKAAGEKLAEDQKSDIAGNVTADMSDEKIAELYPNSQEEAKAQRTEAALDEIDGYVNASNWEGARNAVDKYYESGAIGDDDRQSFYLQDALSDIDVAAKDGKITAKSAKAEVQKLEKLKNEGKISNADFEEAKEYVYRSISTVVEGDSVKITTGGYRNKTDFDIEINGETIKRASFANMPADGEIKDALDAAAGKSPPEGTLVLYDDGVYVYVNSNGYNGWYKASRNWLKEGVNNSSRNKRIYDIIKDDIAPTQASPKKPGHKAD
jgi:hypothetical protein